MSYFESVVPRHGGVVGILAGFESVHVCLAEGRPTPGYDKPECAVLKFTPDEARAYAARLIAAADDVDNTVAAGIADAVRRGFESGGEAL